MVSSVYKKTTNLKLHFFSNYPEIANMNIEESISCCTDDDFSSKNGHQNGDSRHQSDQNGHQGEKNGLYKEDGPHKEKGH